MIDHCWDSKRTEFIALEYLENGNLKNYIMTHEMPSIEQARQWTIQLVNALKFLHDRGLWHRDIKLENILVSDDLQLKLSDFGTFS